MLVQDVRCGLSKINAHPYILQKNASVAFKGGADTILDEKVESFSNDLIALMNEKPNIKREDIEELIRKTTGVKIAVRPFSEMKQNEQKVKTGAFYYAPIDFIIEKNGQLRPEEGEKKIFVDLPEGNSTKEKSVFIRSMVHEFTHFCQEKYNIYSLKDPLIALMGNTMLSNAAKLCTFDAMGPVRNEYRDTVIGALIERARNADLYETVNIGEADECLNSLMLPVTKGDMSGYCRGVLDKIMSTVPQDANVPHIKKYLFNATKIEEQAYQKGSAASKKYMRDDRNTRYDLLAVMYRNMADVCK